MAIIVDIDVMLARRKMSVAEFAEAVGITPANVAVLKNGRAKAVRFTTLDAVCRVLECQPGDVLRWVPTTNPAASSCRPRRGPVAGEQHGAHIRAHPGVIQRPVIGESAKSKPSTLRQADGSNSSETIWHAIA